MAQAPNPAMDRSIPHDKRWPLLKDTIVDLFIGQDMKLSEVAKHMKERYGFDAQTAHYRYRFKSWNIHKRVTATEKDKISQSHVKRSRAGASTSDIVLNKGGVEKALSENEKAQLRRYAKGKAKEAAASLPAISPGFILQWGFPYHALLSTGSGPFDHPSPSTPPFFTVNSPAADAPSPGGPIDAPSPTTQALRSRASLEHVGMFLEGRSIELLKSLNPAEQEAASVWFHDLFLFSFMTAKYFGRGPTHWNAELIEARSLGAQPAGASPPSRPTRSLPASSDSVLPVDVPEPPSMLCRWSIHHQDEVTYQRAPDPMDTTTASDEQDIEDETTWKPWTENSRPLPELISEGITSNSFSHSDTSLPVSSPIVAKAMEKSRDQLETEACVFAIIAGNYEQLEELLEEGAPANLGRIHPFHQAAANLRGAKGCCLVIKTLTDLLAEHNSIAMLYQNGSGHTVLDMLMVTILRCHTSTRPALVCASFDKPERFPGEGIDICGRYDLDSPCVRRLFASGHVSVPMSWKHVFCHTSAQAICHSIIEIFAKEWSPDINKPSGIFVKTCNHCRQQLTPGPLHTLVLVAYCLATRGSPGETLFGVIAVLSCMLALGADPRQQSDLSHQLLLSDIGSNLGIEQCEHASTTPLGLAHDLFKSSKDKRTSETLLGWEVFIGILEQAETAHVQLQPSVAQCHHFTDYNAKLHNTFCGSPGLGQLWAAVQAELATYRRLEEDQPWVSSNFDLQLLRQSLDTNLDVSVLPFFARDMLKEFTPCGWIVLKGPYRGQSEARLIPLVQDLCSYHFMNMDIWQRTDFCDWGWDRIDVIRGDFPGSETPGESSYEAASSQQSQDVEMIDQGGESLDSNQPEAIEYSAGYQQEGGDVI